jgi:hypothetical protein
MDDLTGLALLVGAIAAAIATVVGAFAGAFVAIRGALKPAISTIVANVEKIEASSSLTEKHSNAMKDALVLATKGEQHALGKAEGVEQERQGQRDRQP